MKKNFTTKLPAQGRSKLAGMVVPASVAKSFESPGRVALKGTINGFPFRTSLFRRQDGTYYIFVKGEVRKGAKARPGDTVKVTLEWSNTVLHIGVPADIQRALAKNGRARAVFDRFTPSQKRAYIDYVGQIGPGEATKTRKRRIERMIEILLES